MTWTAGRLQVYLRFTDVSTLRDTWRDMMAFDELDQAGPIERQLSPISFSTNDPAACLAWLQEIGGTCIPTRGPREVGRVRTPSGGLIIVYEGNLLIAIGPEELAAVGARV
jgi:hypothetical protein